MNRPYLNKTGFNKLAQSIKDYINRKITGYNKLGTASTKDFTTYVSPTQTEQLPISSSVYSAMTNMLRGAYHPAGSKTIAELTSDLLVKANLGNVYKITEDGVTSDLFIGGAGQTIKTGDNAIVLFASEDTYKFSLESGVVDLDAYQKKELTSGALIEDVIPADASASNKLVTKEALNEDIFNKQYFYKTSQTFTAGSTVIYTKVCSYSGQYPFTVRLEGQRINATITVQEISGTSYLNNFRYTLTRICDSVYATSVSSATARAESNYLIVDANNDIWVAVASYSRVKVTVLAPTKVTVDGTVGTPVQTYKVDGYSDRDSKLTSSVTEGSTAPITSGGVYAKSMVIIPFSQCNSTYVATSNLYCCLHTGMLYIKGWVILKAGTLPSNVEIFNIGNFKAYINSIIVGYSRKVNTEPFRFWIDQSSNSIKQNLPALEISENMEIQFDAVIPLQ